MDKHHAIEITDGAFTYQIWAETYGSEWCMEHYTCTVKLGDSVICEVFSNAASDIEEEERGQIYADLVADGKVEFDRMIARWKELVRKVENE